jgi:L-rhamnose isomerase
MAATQAPSSSALARVDERQHGRDFEALSDRLAREGRDADALIAAVHRFEVALPSWAFATGGTRFGRFPGKGEPHTLREKMEDAALVHRLTASAPRISLHVPWDDVRDIDEVLGDARRLGIGFDAMNSNTFQDQPGQAESYKLGSFSNPSAAVRRQAVEHHLRVIEIGKQVGSRALTVWLADGSNYPGQMSLRGSFERVKECLQEVYAALPDDWRLFTEHKPYEPAFYATVVQDWGIVAHAGAVAGGARAVPGGPRPSSAEHEHRARRGAAARRGKTSSSDGRCRAVVFCRYTAVGAGEHRYSESGKYRADTRRAAEPAYRDSSERLQIHSF